MRHVFGGVVEKGVDLSSNRDHTLYDLRFDNPNQPTLFKLLSSSNISLLFELHTYHSNSNYIHSSLHPPSPQ